MHDIILHKKIVRSSAHMAPITPKKAKTYFSSIGRNFQQIALKFLAFSKYQSMAPRTKFKRISAQIMPKSTKMLFFAFWVHFF